MNFLVDGHNLIPKIPGMSLEAPDDEQRLVELLQVYCRVRRQSVEVFFDRAAVGRAGRRQAGVVAVNFVRQGRTADQAIVSRLDELKRAARNWTVVTSDRWVQTEARKRQATVVSSEEFAGELAAALQAAQAARHNEPGELSDTEVDDWLKLFGG